MFFFFFIYSRGTPPPDLACSCLLNCCPRMSRRLQFLHRQFSPPVPSRRKPSWFQSLPTVSLRRVARTATGSLSAPTSFCPKRSGRIDNFHGDALRGVKRQHARGAHTRFLHLLHRRREPVEDQARGHRRQFGQTHPPRNVVQPAGPAFPCPARSFLPFRRLRLRRTWPELRGGIDRDEQKSCETKQECFMRRL